MGNTIMVTGGAGFIGSNFVCRLIRHTSNSVLVVDKLTYAGSRLNLIDVKNHRRFKFVRADIADRKKMESLFRSHSPVAVVNFAAETHVDRSIDSPRSFLHTNVMGTFHLLEAARGHLKRIPLTRRGRFRFHHISTDEVFGSLGPKSKFHEGSQYRPNSPYAASKAAADHMVRAYHKTYGVPVLLTNCSNNFGPYQFPEKLIPLTILNALEGKPLPIYGDGKNVRDWIFVDDHCEGLWRVLTNGRPGDTFNIGADEERTNVAVIKTICSCLEELVPAKQNPALVSRNIPRYDALVRFVADRPGHDRRYAIDARKIRRELGWKPRHSFKDALRKTVAWYVSNRDWCAAVQRDRYDRGRLGLSL